MFLKQFSLIRRILWNSVIKYETFQKRKKMFWDDLRLKNKTRKEEYNMDKNIIDL